MTSTPEKKKPLVSGLEFARKVASIAAASHTEDIVILDLRDLSPVTDFFVIGTGTSDRQMRSVSDDIEDYARQTGQKPFGISGYDSPTWLLVDYVDVVVHLFDADRRGYYDLELLWGDAPRIDWQSPESA